MPPTPTSIHLLAVRLTRLNPDGTVNTTGTAPKNSIVTTALTHLNWTSEQQAGDSKVVVGGGDCICVQYRGQDKLLRLTFELEMCRLEPVLMEMMLGTPLLLTTGATPQPVGFQFPTTLGCGEQRQPVAVEAWSTAWDGDTPMAGTPYLHWVFPKSFWQIGNGSLQNDFFLPTLTGYTEDNPAWGVGPYDDTTRNPGPRAAVYLDDFLPVSTDGDYATAA